MKNFRRFKQLIALVLVFAMLITNVSTFAAAPAFASGPTEITYDNDGTGELELKLIGRYDSGAPDDEGGAEIVDYDPVSKKAFATNGYEKSLDILDLSTLNSDSYSVVQRTYRIGIEDLVGVSDITSVAINPDESKNVVAVAVPTAEKTDNGTVVFINKDGSVIDSVYVGALPDMITFTPDGNKLLVANEGEPNDDYTVDPVGSVSIIDIANGADNSVVNNVYFDDVSYDDNVRIFGENATPEQDFEPEYIAVEDNDTAYVVLQENNAIAKLDIANEEFTHIYGLGFKDHSVAGNELDASNGDDTINIRNWPVLGMYMPDGTDVFTKNGTSYVLTANEGDSRDYDGYSEEERVKDITDDIQLNADNYDGYSQQDLDNLVNNSLFDDDQLGRLKITTANGKNAEGKYEALYSYGARSFSIWNADNLEQVYDSGDDFEKITATALPEYFNTNNDEVKKDGRSDDKGPEPEAIVVGQVDGKDYAFIGLERVGGIMVYNVTNPEAPEFVTYYTSRDFSSDIAGDVAPEGLKFIPADESPNGEALLLAANEVSGTISFMSVTSKDEIEIINPYETVDWTAFDQYKANFHAHSIESDGGNTPKEMFEDHYAKDFDIMALTDHNFLNTTWDRTDRPGVPYLTTERLTEMNAGTDRGGRGIIGIPNSDEQSKSDHLNTFFAPFNNESGDTLESKIAKCEDLGGISHINHPGRYTGGKVGGIAGEVASYQPETIEKYVDLFSKYPSCVGMEIINKKDGDSASDRILWDNILKQMMPERPVWGFSNDDAHSTSTVGFSYNMMLMPENTLINVRTSMEDGTFYAVALVSKRELGTDFVASGPAPKITDIAVDEGEDSITIQGENYNEIEWIADGSIIATGSTLDINDYDSEITNYVRAQLKGDGGISFTQPFGIVGGSTEQAEPELKTVKLEADGDTLSGDSTTGIKLDLTAKDNNWNDMSLSPYTINYKTDKEGIVNISEDGTVTLQNQPTQTETVKIWAEVIDGDKTISSNEVSILVTLPGTITKKVNNEMDSIEEEISSGSMDDGSSDLELVWEKPDNDDKGAQLVGIRFDGLNIPKEAIIETAYIQFTVDEPNKSTEQFDVDIYVEDVANSAPFTKDSYNISSRDKTNSSVEWKDIPLWTEEHEAGEDQQTPDLSSLVQEIVNMDDWNEGNAISFILSGTGNRTAESYAGEPDMAPTLNLTYTTSTGSAPKNVIFLIGDGMGEEQIKAARDTNEGSLFMDSVDDATGYMSTMSLGTTVTDSAAAGTALATGYKTNNAMIGMLPDGSEAKTLVEMAEEEGLATGLVSTTPMAHATPATFAAHVTFRKMMNTIAAQYLDNYTGNPIEVLLGGGRNNFDDRANSYRSDYGEESDSRDLISDFQDAGYTYVSDGDGLNAVTVDESTKLLGLFHENSGFPYDQEPHIKDMTAKALEVLAQDEDGFFLMVEGGLIDWMGHANDLDANINETLAFDEAVKAALDFQSEHPDTLIVVTADHETGGLTWNDSKEAATWTHGGNTNVPVPYMVEGPGADLFSGEMVNTEVAQAMMEYLGFNFEDTNYNMVTAVEEVEEITVEQGTSTGDVKDQLPEKVEVTLEDGTTAEVDVYWEAGYSDLDYDADTSGTYTFTGALWNLPEGAYYTKDVEPTVQVTVGEVDGWSLTIMHTNDTHGYLAEVDKDDSDGYNKDEANIAKRATAVNEIRNEASNSLLLDAGDVFSGALYFTKNKGDASVEFMNMLGYDAMTLGNHEFDYGPELLRGFIDQTQFPLVNANLDFSSESHLSDIANTTVGEEGQDTLDGQIFPEVILDVNGEKVGLIGLDTESLNELSSPEDNIVINNAFDAAEDAVAELEDNGVNKIIAITHLGWNNDLELAEAVEGIDIIVGGHSHTVPDEYPTVVTDTENNTPTVVVQAGEHGEQLGQLDIVFDNNGIVTGQEGNLLNVSEYTEDTTVAVKLADYSKELTDYMETVVGKTDVELDGLRDNVRSKETNLGNLIADSMLDKASKICGATLAITNGGGIRDSINQGDITLDEVLTVMPFGNTLTALELTGEQIITALENGVSNVGKDNNGRFPHVAGMRYTWDPEQESNRIISVGIKTENGFEPINLQAKYWVATNNYIANGGDGYDVFTKASNRRDLGYTDYIVFNEYLSENSPVSLQVEGRIKTGVIENKPYTIKTDGILDRTNGLNAAVNVCRTLQPDNEGNEVVVFQLMKDQTPKSIVALEKDIQSSEDMIAHFTETGKEFWVKSFIFDEFNSDTTSVQTNLAAAQVLQ